METDKYIGQMLDGRYEILECIGAGGMAVVYKARCHRLNRLVAVKILKEELAGDPEFKRRFQTESQAVAMLSHPNIVSVYDVSKTGNTDYIVMELIEGITLKQYINRKGVLNWKETLHFTTQIVKALSHAHSRGIIHRDIKPHNIMILKDGSVKVADFGIAQLLSSQSTLTQEALGSVHYISPEQAKGAHVDTRTDLYSVGVVMYEMLTSRLPFVGDSAVAVAIQHISAIPLLPREINPDIPVGLEEIAMHAMEPDVSRRYVSADEMLVDLEEFRKNPGIAFGYELRSEPISTDVIDGNTMTLSSDEVKKAVPAVKKQSKPVKRTVSRPELTKDEYRDHRRKSNRTSLLIGVFCILVFLIVMFVFAYRFVIKDLLDPEDEMITIPQFVTQNYYDFYEDPQYTQYFNFNPEHKYSEYEEGYVISQSPLADRQVAVSAAGIDIDLVVSLGPEPEEVIYMESLVGQDYREAITKLEALNLNLDIKAEPRPDDSVTKDCVLTQYPNAGDPLVEGGSVFITYSSGPEIEMTNVPNVVGLTQNEAQLRLESYDLSFEITEEFSDKPAGEVIFQSIEAGEEVEVHTKVSLIISKGPEEVEDEPPVIPDDPENPDDPNNGVPPGTVDTPTNPDDNNANNDTGINDPTGIIDRLNGIFGRN